MNSSIDTSSTSNNLYNFFDILASNCRGDYESDNHDYMNEKDFTTLCEASVKTFNDLKSTYKPLFEHKGITKGLKDKIYPSTTIDIEMDEIEVLSIKEEKNPYLCTSGLGVCIAVMARGFSQENGAYIALSHFSSTTPTEVLSEIKKRLTACGCEKIEFYLVGGQLPYRDGPEVPHSIDNETEFLSLSKDFNIVGVQFNLAKGLEESLSVIISKDEIVWAIGDFEFESSNDESFEIFQMEKIPYPKKKSYSSSSDSCEEQVKKAKLESFIKK